MKWLRLSTTNWNEIYQFLKAIPRKVTINRKTKETDINVELNLDGSGKGFSALELVFLTTC